MGTKGSLTSIASQSVPRMKRRWKQNCFGPKKVNLKGETDRPHRRGGERGKKRGAILQYLAQPYAEAGVWEGELARERGYQPFRGGGRARKNETRVSEIEGGEEDLKVKGDLMSSEIIEKGIQPHDCSNKGREMQ